MAYFLPLPKEIQDKIYMMSNSPTPTAKLFKGSLQQKFRYLITDKEKTINESAFARGCFNGHFQRKTIPHKLTSDNDRDYRLTPQEEEEYWIGYEHEFPSSKGNASEIIHYLKKLKNKNCFN